MDLLVETTIENGRTFSTPSSCPPDSAASQVTPGEVDQYGVMRICDEIMVDLVKSSCGVDYTEAIREAI
ncbi:MAG: hypothetical protein K1X78_15995 [Verrucomicrobiaceae bacterium]|nr:hypothetical protein [Verrucomicrobiaceae bacterium]